MEITVQIIYASTLGNTEFVVEKIAEYLQKRKVKVALCRAELTDISVVKNNTHFLFGTSTWNHGIINPYFDKLVSEMKNLNLDKKYAGFVGLGDYRYEEVLFCHGIEILEDLFIKRGGKKIGSILKIDGDPFDQVDTVIKDWREDFFLKLKQTYV